jgi:hypothetical protein
MHGGQPLYFEPGVVYFLNTLMAHSPFSLRDDLLFVVCNVLINAESVATVKAHLWDK